MTDNAPRLYRDLAWLWPLWGHAEEYQPESELFAKLIKQYARIEVQTILDMGCGGGKNACHLKRHFALTGIDLSEQMLALARELNPECDFQIADMRDLDLGREFGAVFINDSVSYMTTRDELVAAFRCAFRHLRPGGVLITYPDSVKETFVQGKTDVSTAQGTARPHSLGVTFVENSYDPDPDDTSYEYLLICLIREDGELRIEHDLHRCGLFPLDVWHESLRDIGFEVHQEGWGDITGPAEEPPVFVCVKPVSASEAPPA